MHRFPRSSQAFLLAICVVDILFLYPKTTHEIGVDSFVFHGMAMSIATTHRALWILNPLSYFGLFPLSEPGGSVFLIAANSELNGLGIEGSILVIDIAVTILGSFAAFLLGREILRRDGFALLFALVMSTTPEFVSFLTWQVPTRVVFTALIPVLLWGIIRSARTRAPVDIVVTMMVFLLMMSFHRLAVLMLLVAVASMATMILLVALKTLRLNLPSIFLSSAASRNASWFAFGGFLAIAGFMVASSNLLAEYAQGELASGTSPAIELLNLTVSLTRNVGILLFLAPLGILVMTRRRAKGFRESLIVLATLAFVPTLFLRQYTGFYTIPFLSLLALVGLERIIARMKSNRKRVGVVAAAVVVTLASSYGIVTYNLSHDTELTGQQYSLGLYGASLPTATWVFNDGLNGARTASVTGRPYLPIGGATTSFQGPELLMFSFVNRHALSIRPVGLSQLTIESDSVFTLDGVQAEADWSLIMSSNVNSIPYRLVQAYAPKYVVALKDFPTQYQAYGHFYNSALLQSLPAARYVIYADARVVVWQL